MRMVMAAWVTVFGLLAVSGVAWAQAAGRTSRAMERKAAFHGDKDLAELLLAKGAKVSAVDNGGWTPLYQAANKDVAELLLAKGANVNAVDQEGRTPLHQAAYMGHKDVAELLLAKGADVNAVNKWGETPLHRAAANGYNETVELLRKHGGK